MNEAAEILPAEEEQIVRFAVQKVINQCGGVAPDVFSNVEREDADPEQEIVFDAIDLGAQEITPLKSHLIAGDVRRRIFHGIISSLRFADIPDEDEIYDFLPDIGGYDFHHEDHNHDTLSDPLKEALFVDAVEEEARLCGDRFDLFLQYIQPILSGAKATSSETDKIISQIKQCFEKIAFERQKINKFRPKNSEKPVEPLWGQQDLTAEHASSLDHVYNIFQYSSAEEDLIKFLPKGFKKAESYLFDFNITIGTVLGGSISDQEQHIRQVIYERKLLIYYFASTGRKNLKDLRNLRYLRAEIIQIQNNKSSSEDNADSIYDVSFLEDNVWKVNFLIQYSQKQSLFLADLLQKLHDILVGFLLSVQSFLSDTDLTDEKKKCKIHTRSEQFSKELDKFLIGLTTSGPVTNKIREICESIKEQLSHKEIDS